MPKIKQQQNHKNIFEQHAGVTIFVFISFIFIIFDFLAALLFVRSTGNDFRTQHFYYHHGLNSNYSGDAIWGKRVYSFHTNSLGFRDSICQTIDLKNNNRRVLLMGDSHMEAVGIAYRKSVSGILSDSLSSSNIEILNASAVSYSPRIHYLKAKYLIEEKNLHINDMIVFIDISDMQNELAYKTFNPSNNNKLMGLLSVAKKWLMKHSFIWNRVDQIVQQNKLNDFLKTAQMFDAVGQQKMQGNTVELYSSFFSHFDDKQLLSNPNFHGVGKWYYNDAFRPLADKGITLGQQNIVALHQLCKKHNIRLALSVHPWQPQVSKMDSSDYYVQHWQLFCENEGINFINLFPLFINERNSELVQETQFIKGDNHWNENGNRLVADYLIKFIKAW